MHGKWKFAVNKDINNNRARSLNALHMSAPSLGGKIVISGIGGVEQDEFMLNLLNEQV